MPVCNCKLCQHRLGVETPLHPYAFEQWARHVSAAARDAERIRLNKAAARYIKDGVIDNQGYLVPR